MPSHYLIPYVYIKGHKDPDLRAFAYGESGSRAVTLKRTLTQGSSLFFHTKIGSNKYITAHFVVDKILSREQAEADPTITCDGKTDDILILGDPKLSKRLRKPVLFNKPLASKLSLNIDFREFDNRKRTELQVIGSATRQHRLLTDRDVDILVEAIQNYEINEKIQNPREVQSHLYFYDESEEYIPIDEVQNLREHEIQRLLRKNPESIEPGAKLLAYEKVLPDGDRLDLLLEASDCSLIVAELKGPNCLLDDIPTQLASYVRDIHREYPNRMIRKMIVCDGKISPKLRKACEEFEIEIVVYGVKLGCFKLS